MVRDANYNQAQTSALTLVNFSPATISLIQYSISPSILASRNTYSISFKSTVAYESGVQINVGIPTGFSSDGVTCKLNNVDVLCTSGADQKVSITAASGFTKADILSLTMTSILTPSCASASLLSFSIGVKSYDNYEIETGLGAFDTSTLSGITLTVVGTASSAQQTGATADYTFDITYTGLLQMNSIVEIILPSQATWMTSGNSRTFDSTACNFKPFSGSILQCPIGVNRSGSVGVLHTVLSGISNPKTIGVYPVLINVYIQSTCKYASGSASLNISSIANSKALSFEVSNSYQYAWVPYHFDITPSTDKIDTGDYFELLLPSSMSLDSLSFDCYPAGTTYNITCIKQIGSTTVANIIPTFFANFSLSNKTIGFNISYIMNPSNSIQNLTLSLKSAAGQTYETGSLKPNDSIGPLIPALAFMFSSKYRGDPGLLQMNLTQSTFVPANSYITLTFSSKFAILSNLTLNDSSPPMFIDQKETDFLNRKLYIRLDSPAKLGSLLSFKLKINNPGSTHLDPEDLLVDLTYSGKTIYASKTVINTQLPFYCNETCSECSMFWNYCTVCFAGNTLREGTCYPTREEQSYPFIFLGVILATVLAGFVIGVCVKWRNYWGNFLFSIVKIIMLMYFAVFAYFIYINEDFKWYWYSILTVYGIHILLSTFTCLIACIVITNQAKSNEIPMPTSSHRQLSPNQKEDATSRAGQNIRSCWFYFLLIASSLFTIGIMRWFYSASGSSRGSLWTLNRHSFTTFQLLLERFQIIYFFLVIVAMAVLTSVSFSSHPYKFKIELLALCAIDTMVYIWAYIELRNGSDREFTDTHNEVAIQEVKSIAYFPGIGKNDYSVAEPSMLLDEEEANRRKNGAKGVRAIRIGNQSREKPILGNEDGDELEGDRIDNITMFRAGPSYYKEDPLADGDIDERVEQVEETPVSHLELDETRRVSLSIKVVDPILIKESNLKSRPASEMSEKLGDQTNPQEFEFSGEKTVDIQIGQAAAQRKINVFGEEDGHDSRRDVSSTTPPITIRKAKILSGKGSLLVKRKHQRRRRPAKGEGVMQASADHQSPGYYNKIEQGTDVPEFDFVSPFNKHLPIQVVDNGQGRAVPVIYRVNPVSRSVLHSQGDTADLSSCDQPVVSSNTEKILGLMEASTNNYSTLEQFSVIDHKTEVKSKKLAQSGSHQPESVVQYKVGSQYKPLSEMHSTIKKPVSSISQANSQNNIWWYTAAPNYLEIIYEEGEKEEAALYENPNYDEPQKKRWGREIEKEFWNKHMHKELGIPLAEEDGDQSKEYSKEDQNSLANIPIGSVLQRSSSNLRLEGAGEDGIEGEEETKNYDQAINDILNTNYSQRQYRNEPQVTQAEDGSVVSMVTDSVMNNPQRIYKLISVNDLNRDSSLSDEVQERQLHNNTDEQLTFDDIIDLTLESTIKSVNGQLIGDIECNQYRDKEGVVLRLADQRMTDLLKGVLVDETGRRLMAKFNSKGDLHKGIVRTHDNRPLLLRHQSFQEMDEKGILRDRRGNIVEINGQKASDMANGVLKVDNGKAEIKIEDQKIEKLEKGVFRIPSGREVRTGLPQNIDDMKRGLIMDDQGFLRRLIDQSMEEIARGYPQDSTLKQSQETAFHRNRETFTTRDESATPKAQLYNLPKINFDTLQSPHKSNPDSHNTFKKQKELSFITNCYFDEKGQPILTKDLTDNTKLYDGFGNLISAHDKKCSFYSAYGKKVTPRDAVTADTLYDQLCRPIWYNSLGFFTKFYNRQGNLVDYLLLQGEDCLHDSEGNHIPLDLLDRSRRFLTEDGSKITHEEISKSRRLVMDEGRVKITAIEQARCQRLYTADRKLMGPYELSNPQPIFDKDGRRIGEVVSSNCLSLPLLFDRHNKPVDLREAVRRYLFTDSKGTPLTREDIERDAPAFNPERSKLTQAEFRELLEDPTPEFRVYTAQCKEISVDRLVRDFGAKDRLKRPVDADRLRRQGKLFDIHGKAVTGAVLARVGRVLEAIHNLYPQEPEDERISELTRTHHRRFTGEEILPGKDPNTDPDRQANNNLWKKGLPEENTKGANKHLDNLQLDLLADESFELDLNVQEVSDSLDMGHYIQVEEPSEGKVFVQPRIFLPSSKIDSSKPQPMPYQLIGESQIDQDTEQKISLHNLHTDKMKINPDWKQNKNKESDSDSEVREKTVEKQRDTSSQYFRFADNTHIDSAHNLREHLERADSVPSAQTRNKRVVAGSVALNKAGMGLNIPKLSAINITSASKQYLPPRGTSIGKPNASGITIGGVRPNPQMPLHLRQAERISFVKQYKPKPQESQPSLRGDSLREIYIDNIKTDKQKHARALSRNTIERTGSARSRQGPI